MSTTQIINSIPALVTGRVDKAGTGEATWVIGQDALVIHAPHTTADVAYELRLFGNEQTLGDMLVGFLASVTGDRILDGLTAREVVCALHTLAEIRREVEPDDLSELQHEVADKVAGLWELVLGDAEATA